MGHSYCLGAVVLTCVVSAAEPVAVFKLAYFECDRVRVRVLETERLRHLLLEGTCLTQYVSASVCVQCLRLKPSSTGSSSTDMAAVGQEGGRWYW